MNILMVLTSHDQLGDTGKKTGFWLEEFAAPYYVLKDAGHTITLASPKGGQPPLDLPRQAGGVGVTAMVTRTMAGRKSALALVPSANPHTTPVAATPAADPRSQAAAKASSVSVKSAISGTSLMFDRRWAIRRGEVRSSVQATSAAVASKRRRAKT